MEVYQTESQQVDAIKQFIFKNRKRILFTVFLALLVIFGGRYWRYQTKVKNSKASDMYQETLVAYTRQDPQLVTSIGENLLKEFPSSNYAQMAALLLAKDAVDNSKLDAAETYLQWALAHSKAQSLLNMVARERLARVMQQQNKFDAALDLLNKSKPLAAFESIYAETIGDLHLAKGALQLAKESYLRALEAMPQGGQSALLQIKLLDLGVSESELKAVEGDKDA